MAFRPNYTTFAAVRKKTLIFVWLFVLTFVMAGMPRMRFSIEEKSKDSVAVDSIEKDTAIASSVLPLPSSVDTTKMDSLQLAIFKHNKAIDDSLHADSLNRQRKNGIDAPVEYSARDSMTYEGEQVLHDCLVLLK